jgi:hypothetical protein
MGIPYTYTTPGQYTITIKPGDPNNIPVGWLRPFGMPFRTNTTSATPCGQAANRNKVVAPLSPINPLMISDQHLGGAQVNNMMTGMFCLCKGYNFHLGEKFGFTPEWDEFKNCSQSTFWCYEMFRESSLKEIPATFRMPQGITHTGSGFCSSMFHTCTNLVEVKSTLLPPGQIYAYNDCYANMFNGCTALTTLNSDFTIPPGLSTGINTGTFNRMFYDCPLLVLPTNFKIPPLTQTQIDKSNALSNMFAQTNTSTLTPQSATPQSILGTMASMIPDAAKNTFRVGASETDTNNYGVLKWGSGVATLHDNWK